MLRNEREVFDFGGVSVNQTPAAETVQHIPYCFSWA